MAVSDNRPFYLNLIKIKLPVTGFVSIFHRISGLLMFLAVPYGVYLLGLSVEGETGFEAIRSQIQQPLIQLAFLILLWSIIHHLLAGIRFLLIDFDIGLEKEQANFFSWLVFGLEAVIFIWLTVVIIL